MPRFLLIGRGTLASLPEATRRTGAKRPLIVTDGTMVRLGHVDRIRGILAKAGVESGVFAEVQPDPVDTMVLKGIKVLDSGKFDSVIALGGGSSIDTAKAIAVMSQYGQNLLEYRPPRQFDDPGLPIIAIPTSAGTGSEVTHHTVITHSETKDKISCRGEGFVPMAAILDYELTVSQPGRMTADTALDTLTHAVEAYTSAKSCLFSDRMALDCMRLVGTYLARAYDNPNDYEARENLLYAAMLGGLAFSNSSVALVHAMSRPLGSLFHVPHGLSNAMLLLPVLEFSIDSARDRYAACARAIGLAQPTDDDETAGRLLLSGLSTLQARVEVPTMAQFGIDYQEYLGKLSEMAEAAIRSGSPNNNPRIPTHDEIVAVYKTAWSVDLALPGHA